MHSLKRELAILRRSSCAMLEILAEFVVDVLNAAKTWEIIHVDDIVLARARFGDHVNSIDCEAREGVNLIANCAYQRLRQRILWWLQSFVVMARNSSKKGEPFLGVRFHLFRISVWQRRPELILEIIADGVNFVDQGIVIYESLEDVRSWKAFDPALVVNHCELVRDIRAICVGGLGNGRKWEIGDIGRFTIDKHRLRSHNTVGALHDVQRIKEPGAGPPIDNVEGRRERVDQNASLVLLEIGRNPIHQRHSGIRRVDQGVSEFVEDDVERLAFPQSFCVQMHHFVTVLAEMMDKRIESVGGFAGEGIADGEGPQGLRESWRGLMEEQILHDLHGVLWILHIEGEGPF